MGKVIEAIITVMIGVLIDGLVLMLCWNSILVDLFVFPIISFWQSIGLLIMVACFKSSTKTRE